MARLKRDDSLVSTRIDGWKRAISVSAKYLIVVLGPGKSGEGYKKRVQIRDSLTNGFPNCQVVFPEDKAVIVSTSSAVGRSVEVQELLLFSRADIIIALHVSPSVSSELTIITRIAALSARTVAFNHVKHRRSRSFLIEMMANLPQRNVKWFSESEFKSCTLATKRAHDVVRAFAIRASAI